MQKYLDAGGSLIFVSHSPYPIRAVCRSGILLQEGRLTFAEPGVGELRCTVPHLPLVAGEYRLRVARLDPNTRLPLALLGWTDPALPLRVRARASQQGNAAMAIQQLVTIDVDWE